MKFFKKIALACLLFTAIALTQPNTANAGWFSRFFAKKVPVAPSLTQIYPIQDDKAFQNVAKVFHKIPFNNPELEYSILLPKDWTSQETIQSDSVGGGLNAQIISEIARYQSPVINTMKASAVIESIQLTHEISAKNWLKNYIYSSSCTPQGKLVAISDKKATAKCITTINGDTLYIHALAAINGNNLILVKFECPLYLTGPLNFIAQKALDSFKFILVTDHPIEQQKIFSFANAVRFSYPVSWVPNGLDTSDNNSMYMQLFNESAGRGKRKQIDGMIRFMVVRRDAQTSLQKEAARMKAYFNSFLGLTFTKLVSSEKTPAAKRFLFSRYETYRVATKSQTSHDQEVRLVVLGSKSWYVFAFLLTPTESDNFYTWACNTQAFDMIVKSLH